MRALARPAEQRTHVAMHRHPCRAAAAVPGSRPRTAAPCACPGLPLLLPTSSVEGSAASTCCSAAAAKVGVQSAGGCLAGGAHAYPTSHTTQPSTARAGACNTPTTHPASQPATHPAAQCCCPSEALAADARHSQQQCPRRVRRTRERGCCSSTPRRAHPSSSNPQQRQTTPPTPAMALGVSAGKESHESTQSIPASQRRLCVCVCVCQARATTPRRCAPP